MPITLECASMIVLNLGFIEHSKARDFLHCKYLRGMYNVFMAAVEILNLTLCLMLTNNLRNIAVRNLKCIMRQNTNMSTIFVTICCTFLPIVSTLLPPVVRESKHLCINCSHTKCRWQHREIDSYRHLWEKAQTTFSDN